MIAAQSHTYRDTSSGQCERDDAMVAVHDLVADLVTQYPSGWLSRRRRPLLFVPERLYGYIVTRLPPVSQEPQVAGLVDVNGTTVLLATNSELDLFHIISAVTAVNDEPQLSATRYVAPYRLDATQVEVYRRLRQDGLVALDAATAALAATRNHPAV